MKKIYNLKSKINAIYISVSLFLTFILINNSVINVYGLSPTDPGYIPPSSVSTRADFMSKVDEFLSIRNLLFNSFIGFTVLTTVGIFIYNFCKLAFVSTNPKERKQVLRNLLIAGGCLTLEGCSTTIWVLLNWYTT